MGFSDVIEKIKERNQSRKDLIKDLDDKIRIEELVNERRKSSNQRELESYMKEDNEENIKVQLEKMRKIRKEDITFKHNPLDVKNITNHTDWQVLKEKNLFASKKNMFSNNEMVHKNNPNLLKNAKWLMK